MAAQAVASYFLDMQRVAARCREFLSANGVAMFVIGNTRYCDVEIDNAAHLTEALLQVGFGSVRAARRRISNKRATPRSEEHTSELQSLMRISYAVFCLKKKNKRIFPY